MFVTIPELDCTLADWDLSPQYVLGMVDIMSIPDAGSVDELVEALSGGQGSTFAPIKSKL